MKLPRTRPRNPNSKPAPNLKSHSGGNATPIPKPAGAQNPAGSPTPEPSDRGGRTAHWAPCRRRCPSGSHALLPVGFVPLSLRCGGPRRRRCVLGGRGALAALVGEGRGCGAGGVGGGAGEGEPVKARLQGLGARVRV